MKLNIMIGLLAFNAVMMTALYYEAYKGLEYRELDAQYWRCRQELNVEASATSKALRGLAYYRRRVKLGELVERGLSSAPSAGGAYVGADVELGALRKAE